MSASPTTPAQALASIAEMETYARENPFDRCSTALLRALAGSREGWTEVERLTDVSFNRLRNLEAAAMKVGAANDALAACEAKAQSLAEEVAGLQAALYEVDFQCTTVLRGRPRSKQLRALAMTGQVISTMALAGNTKDFKARQLARQALGEQP